MGYEMNHIIQPKALQVSGFGKLPAPSSFAGIHDEDVEDSIATVF